MKKGREGSGSTWEALRIGGLHYRNALPLQRGLERAAHYQLGTPAEMAAAFSQGDLDLALLPIAAILQGGWEKGMVPGLAIAARGPVYSVYVTWPLDSPPPSLTVHRDPNSRSSNILYEVLRREVTTLREQFGPLTDQPPTAAPCARVLIGDPAVAFRRRHEKDHAFLDLAALWREHTGLPFVFARWVCKQSPDPSLVEALTALREENLATLEQWTASWEECAFWRDYLRGLSYVAGEEDENALRLFAEKARRYHLLKPL